jgi:hypothetical protein
MGEERKVVLTARLHATVIRQNGRVRWRPGVVMPDV